MSLLILDLDDVLNGPTGGGADHLVGSDLPAEAGAGACPGVVGVRSRSLRPKRSPPSSARKGRNWV